MFFFHLLNADSSSPEVQIKQKSKSSRSKEQIDKSLQKPDSSSSLAKWLTAAPSPVLNVSSSSNPKTQKPSSSKSTIKDTTVKRKRIEDLPLDDISESEGEDLDSISDELDSDDEDSVAGPLQDQIIQFLQEASLDELALISRCSVKKAQKIISLRPFNTWKDVVCLFIGTLGCEVFLLLSLVLW